VDEGAERPWRREPVAPATPDLDARGHAGQEALDERRLSATGLRADQAHAARSGLRGGEGVEEDGERSVALDEVHRRDTRYGPARIPLTSRRRTTDVEGGADGRHRSHARDPPPADRQLA